MSLVPSVQSPLGDQSSPMPFASDTSETNPFWSQRLINQDFFPFTSSYVEMVYWRVFGGLALLGAGSLGTLVVIESISLSAGLLAIPTILFASYAFWQSSKLEADEEEELVSVQRAEAQRLTLSEVVCRHSWDELFSKRLLTPSQFVNHYRRYVQSLAITDLIDYYERVSRHLALHHEERGGTYVIPHPREHAHRWRTETQNKTFEQIITEYPLDQLERYSLVSHTEMQKIRELLAIYTEAKQSLERIRSEEQQQFDRATDGSLLQLLVARNEADRIYVENPSVQQLQSFERQKSEARLQIESESSARLRAARQAHQERIAPLYPNGYVIARENLPNEQRALYDQALRELHQQEVQISQSLNQRLSEHDAHYQMLRSQLELEEQGLRASRDQEKQQAQELYEERTRPALTVKLQRLQPHEEEFKMVVKSLNGIYKSYLRQLALIQ